MSARISAAFLETNTSWRAALIGVGIAGGIISIVMVLILREPEKRMVRLIAEEKEVSSPCPSLVRAYSVAAPDYARRSIPRIKDQ